MSSHQMIRLGSIFLLFVIQIVFLLAIFNESTSSALLAFFILTIGSVLLLSFLKSPIHQHKISYEEIKTAAWVPFGAIASYLLNHRLGLGSVFAASLVGLIGSLLPFINKKSAYFNQIPAAIYCGSFIGMSSTNIAQDSSFILVASILTALLLIISKSLLHGIGGKLGTLAFAGVAITYVVLFLWSHIW